MIYGRKIILCVQCNHVGSSAGLPGKTYNWSFIWSLELSKAKAEMSKNLNRKAVRLIYLIPVIGFLLYQISFENHAWNTERNVNRGAISPHLPVLFFWNFEITPYTFRRTL